MEGGGDCEFFSLIFSFEGFAVPDEANSTDRLIVLVFQKLRYLAEVREPRKVVPGEALVVVVGREEGGAGRGNKGLRF